MAEREYVISTETTCDMPKSYYAENGINLLGLTYTIGGKDYDSAAGDSLSSAEFYQMIREGAMPKTSQVSIEKAAQSFEKLVRQGKDIFHLAFSSGLSGTFQSLSIAAKEVMDHNPGSKIVVVDSLAASMGQGLMLNYAVQLKKEGKALDELAGHHHPRPAEIRPQLHRQRPLPPPPGRAGLQDDGGGRLSPRHQAAPARRR